MATQAQSIPEREFKMSVRDRAQIAQQLLKSPDRQVDTDVESEWQPEIEKRISEFNSGRASGVPWEKALDQLLRSSHG